MRRAVAGPAGGTELNRRSRSRGCAVGIVAGEAGQPAAALQEAFRLSQAVSGADNFELVVVARASRPIEVHDIVAQALARPERIDGTAEPRDCLRQSGAGDLEMTLLADV